MYSLSYLFAKFMKKIMISAIIRSKIDKNSHVGSGCHIVDSSFDRFSYCGSNTAIIRAKIGSFCSISDNVLIGGAMHPIENVSTSPSFYGGKGNGMNFKLGSGEQPIIKETIILNDVWIGNSVVIKSGVTIGNGAVLGMGSVVTKDVPPYAIVAGNPAKLIRYRFSEEIINNLNNSRWWEFDNDHLRRLSPYMGNPEEFIKHIK